MDRYQCTDCKWEGDEDDRVEVTEPHHDHSCPECGCRFLINLTEDEYITNWARTVNRNDI
jgi:DNA-directed RNA polymerase subunit RPC12/RpoP